MKQILQSLASGETMLVDVPVPSRKRDHLLIRTKTSLVSLGTEKMLVDFGKAGWIAKARQQPDKVKQVLQKVKTDGLWTTLEAVQAKLGQPIPLGYSQVGVVEEVESHLPFQAGQRVISNGPHAEWVVVPHQLCAAVPDQVGDEEAAFTVVGAIGLQGIRLLQPTLGERIAVFGLGLIGLMAVQILRANGCHVLGIDFDETKLNLAAQFGAQTVSLGREQDPLAAANEWTQGEGVDGVLVTASTKSHELMHQAASMCRKRGRIVLVGVAGMQLQRADFYEKELSFQVSCSYGPGRYDPEYEKKGLDYPIGFVRWTEQRNFQAVLEMMATGRLDVRPLTTHRYFFDQAVQAYEAMSDGKAMGILLDYSQADESGRTSVIHLADLQSGQAKPNTAKGVRENYGPTTAQKAGALQIGVLGAGGFATRMLLPILKKLSVRLKTIVSSTGVNATYAGRKFGFESIASDPSAVLDDPTIDAVVIATPHASHARLVVDALNAGKHVFVEKPLALDRASLDEVEQAALRNPNLQWMVGFNRRFSPHSQVLKRWLSSTPQAKSLSMMINAGAIDDSHWTQDPTVGGGRLLGEACHFVDLARFLIGSPIVEAKVQAMGGFEGRNHDTFHVQLRFEDASIASIAYYANGHQSFPKERIEVFAQGKIGVCNNFRSTHGYGFAGKLKTWKQDKGHVNGMKAFVHSLVCDSPSIPVAEMLEVSRVMIELHDQLFRPMPVQPEPPETGLIFRS